MQMTFDFFGLLFLFLKNMSTAGEYFILFQTSSGAGAGNGDQGEMLKLQRTIKVSSSLLLRSLWTEKPLLEYAMYGIFG